MKPLIRAGGFAPVLLLALSFVQNSGASGSVSSILKCMADNIPRSSSIQNIEFRSESVLEDAAEDFYDEGVRILRASVYLSRISDNQRRVLAYFHEPFEVRGARVLLIEKESGNETFLYAPVLGDVRRLTGRHISSSVNGTDFSYEDLEQLYGMAKGGAITRLADSELNGREVYVLKSVSSAGSESTYPRINSYVDKQTCVTLTMKLYGKGDRLRKIYTVDPESLRQVNGLWVPYKMAMRDVRNMTETKLILHKLEVDAFTRLDYPGDYSCDYCNCDTTDRRPEDRGASSRD